MTALAHELVPLLAGRWFIQRSNFPMWLKGDKQHPTFDYVVEQRADGPVLIDTVGYEKNGVHKTIRGIDTPVPGSAAFVWRGAGLLCLLTSHWDVLFVDEARGWALIHFTKTLFTPEGYDVISRAPTMDEATQQQVTSKLGELGITAALSSIPQR